jgi:hypothetical protein
MLSDKDRIFKNLYGLHGWRFQGASVRCARERIGAEKQ